MSTYTRREATGDTRSTNGAPSVRDEHGQEDSMEILAYEHPTQPCTVTEHYRGGYQGVVRTAARLGVGSSKITYKCGHVHSSREGARRCATP